MDVERKMKKKGRERRKGIGKVHSLEIWKKRKARERSVKEPKEIGRDFSGWLSLCVSS